MGDGQDPPQAAAAWDELWARVRAADDEFPPPAARVVRAAGRLRGAGVRRVLDLGCGPGRHTVYLAAGGFDVVATDHSAFAVDACRRALAAAGLVADVGEGPMTALGLADGSVDWVVAVNVLYHGRRSDMGRAVAEVRRVLRPGGWLLATFLSEADDKLRWYRGQCAAGRAEQVEPGTYRALFRGPTDEHVPHTFISEVELRADVLAGFDVIEFEEERKATPLTGGAASTDAYWHVLARRAG